MRRLPFAPATFDVVVNLFTSFGYFADDAQHQLVMMDVSSVLKPGGMFVLDFFNSTDLEESLVEHEERAVGGQRVIIDRHITDDSDFVVKEMHLIDDGRKFVERVRLFRESDLERLMNEAGLRVTTRFGDYDASALTPRSPRIILMAERP
jgi:SAM-dependent methyltransferase